MSEKIYKANELTFSAGARCRCGSGLAYPNPFDRQKDAHQWSCAAVLMGEIPDVPEEHGKHDAYPWALYDIKSDCQPSADNRTTRRPQDGLVEVRGGHRCRGCRTEWWTPWRRPGAPSVWKSDPCPTCGRSAYGSHGGGDTDTLGTQDRVVFADAPPPEEAPAVRLFDPANPLRPELVALLREMTQSEHSISFSLEPFELAALLDAYEQRAKP